MWAAAERPLTAGCVVGGGAGLAVPGGREQPRPPSSPRQTRARDLCYAIVLPGRSSGFRVGFRSNSIGESLKIGRPAGLRLERGPIL